MVFGLVALVVFGFALLAVGIRRGREAARRERALSRLPPCVDAGALDDRLGDEVALDGELEGGPIATEFPGAARAIEEPHARAKTIAPAGPVVLRVGARAIALVPPFQVVLGAVETATTEGDLGSRRTLRDKDTLRAVGRLARVSASESEGGYRDRAYAYELHAAPEAGWEHRPIALYATRGGPRALGTAALLVLALGAIGSGATGALHLRRPPAPTVRTEAPAFARPACARDVDAKLDTADPWAARDLARACDDVAGRAEAAWMLGDFADATDAFTALRARDLAHVITAPEAESAMIVDLRAGARLVGELKGQWYKGPHDTAQERLDCIAKRLLGVAGNAPSWPEVCLSGRAELTYSNAEHLECGHYLPAYSLHDPAGYARFVPLGDLDTNTASCGVYLTMLRDASQSVCLANAASTRMLHYATTGEATKYEDEARAIDRMVDALPTLDAAHVVPADGEYGAMPTADELSTKREEMRYDAQRDLAVAASAAWFAHDDARVKRYVPYAEAHARAILEEHLRLVAGEQKAPAASHSPSDYSAVDMDLFATIDQTAPDAFAAKLAQSGFTSPARLAALLGARPANRGVLRTWLARGYPKVCRGCGLYALLDSTFRRRFLAELVGETALAAKWLDVTQKLGAGLRKRESYGPVLSLESLLTQT